MSKRPSVNFNKNQSERDHYCLKHPPEKRGREGVLRKQMQYHRTHI